MTWLVAGGAGYIGAHITRAMGAAGPAVVVLDDLSTGDVARIPGMPLVEGNMLDGNVLTRVVRDNEVEGIVTGTAGVVDMVGSAWVGWTHLSGRAAVAPQQADA